MAGFIGILLVVFGLLIVMQNIVDVCQYYVGRLKRNATNEFMSAVSFFDILVAGLLFYEIWNRDKETDESWVLMMAIILFLLLFTAIWRRLIERNNKEE